MSTLFKICFGIAAGLEFIFVPWFLKASRNGRCTKSQILKTICATLFVAAGVLASAIAQNRSDYAHYILIGLLLGWCGDFLLHLPPKMPFTLSGGLAFLAGHVFYIYAYCLAMKRFFPDAPFWDKRELIACAIIIVIGVAAIRLLGVKFSPLYIIGVPYVAMLAFMLVNATMTVLALDCWSQRQAGLPVQTELQQFYAKNFPDEFMQTRFSTMSMSQESALKAQQNLPKNSSSDELL